MIIGLWDVEFDVGIFFNFARGKVKIRSNKVKVKISFPPKLKLVKIRHACVVQFPQDSKNVIYFLVLQLGLPKNAYKKWHHHLYLVFGSLHCEK